MPVEVALGSCREHEMHGATMGHLGGGRHAFTSEAELVDGVLRFRRVVLDGAPGEPGLERHAHGGRDASRIIGETVLEIGRNRDTDRGRDRPTVCDGLVAGHRPVHPAERGGKTTARRREGREPEGLEEPRRPDIPGVRHEQGSCFAV